jgi:hypothetical protein
MSGYWITWNLLNCTVSHKNNYDLLRCDAMQFGYTGTSILEETANPLFRTVLKLKWALCYFYLIYGEKY